MKKNTIFLLFAILIIFFSSCAEEDYISNAIDKENAGNYNGALEDYNKAIKNKTNLAAAYSNRAHIKTILKDYEGAIEDYTEALNHTPRKSEAYYNRGLVHFYMKQNEKALADLDLSIAGDSSAVNARAFHNRGVCKLLLGDDSGAMKDLDKAIELNPKHLYSYLSRASFFAKKGKTKAALKNYSSAIEIALVSEDTSILLACYNNRASIYVQTGKRGKACDDLKKAKEWGNTSKELEVLMKKICD